MNKLKKFLKSLLTGRTKKLKFKYRAPLNAQGKPYWIPVVCKNKDFLIGYISGGSSAMETLRKELQKSIPNNSHIKVPLFLDSSRFNDYIGNTGIRVGDLSDNEYQVLLTEKRKRDEYKKKHYHPENKPNVLVPKYFEVTCLCGNYYSFNSAVEIPEESLKCGLCDNYIIHYIGVDDELIVYDSAKNNKK